MMEDQQKCPRCKTPASPRELTAMYYERESDGEQVLAKVCSPCVSEVRSDYPIYTMAA